MRYPVSAPEISALEADSVMAAINSGRITQGERVERFEGELGWRLDGLHVVACSSGTAALHLALAALGVGPGDEVLVPDLTFVATANAVLYLGATPVLVDVDPVSWNIDLGDAASKVTPRTTTIIPVHLYGVPCDMDAVARFAERHRLAVVEDAAQGFGGSWRGRPLGTHGLMGTFSFYGNKIVTTAEGGAIATRNPDLAARLRLLRGQGMGRRRFFHEAVGYNYRMSDVHAAIGLAQLDRLSVFLQQRRAIFAAYRRNLAPCARPEGVGEAPWLFTLELPGSDPVRVAEALAARGIETRPVFVPLHEMPAFRCAGAFPMASRIARRGISLPTYVGLTDNDVLEISEALLGAL